MKGLLTTLGLVLFASNLSAQGGFLGVRLQEYDGPGTVVREVIIPSAAEIMGLQSGDLMLSISGRKTPDIDTVIEVVGSFAPGDIVTIDFSREGVRMQCRGLLGRNPSAVFNRGLSLPANTFPVFPDLLDMQNLQNLPDIHDMLELFDNMEFQMQGASGHQVQITYPESTPATERESLIAEARETYGDDVSVEFRGNSHMVEIRSTYSNTDDDIPLILDLESLLDGAKFETVAPQLDAAEESLSLEAALETGKPVLLDFTAEWCMPCKMLASQVIDNPEYAELMNSFAVVRVDIDEQADLAARYRVRGIPDLRILSASGEEMARSIGFNGKDEVATWLQQQLAKALADSPGSKQFTPSEGASSDRERLRQELRQEMEKLRAELQELRDELSRLPM